jgi:hypothetical protein
MTEVEPPISHSDVTTIMALLGDLKEDVRESGPCWKRTMGNKNYRKLTPEDRARHEQIMEMVRDRIAYHEAKTREQEEAAARMRSA